MSDRIYSRVTVMDGSTLTVTESLGDFAATVLEYLVNEQKVPGHTHNPPTIIVLESDLHEQRDEDLALLEPTPLARAAWTALAAELSRLAETGGAE